MHSHQPQTSFWLHVSWRSSQTRSRPFAVATFLSLFFPSSQLSTNMLPYSPLPPASLFTSALLWHTLLMTDSSASHDHRVSLFSNSDPSSLLVGFKPQDAKASQWDLTNQKVTSGWPGFIYSVMYKTRLRGNRHLSLLVRVRGNREEEVNKEKKSITTNNIINREQFQGPFASDYQRGHEVDYMQQWHINTGSPAAWACRSMTKGWFSSKKESLKVNLKSREGACFPNLETDSTEDGPDCWRLFLWSMLWE